MLRYPIHHCTCNSHFIEEVSFIQKVVDSGVACCDQSQDREQEVRVPMLLERGVDVQGVLVFAAAHRVCFGRLYPTEKGHHTGSVRKFEER